MTPPSEREFFSEIALAGPALFYAAAFSEDELAAKFARATPTTSREFLVLRTLAEVQKCGVAQRRWREEGDRCAAGNRFDALVLESLTLERVAWGRRLLEALVTLINFSTSNEQPYFAHFLALQEYGRARHRMAEEKDFFGAESELTRRRLAALEAQVDLASGALSDASVCWYVHARDRYRPTTLRKQFLRAVGLALPAERTALGYTYEASFGATSEQLHFGVLDSSLGDDVGSSTEALCSLLSVAIICRAHDLCSIAPKGINKSLMDPTSRARPASELLAARASVGDFVLIGGPHVGEVLEVRTTAFGYESYRIRFLDSQDGPGLEEDWLPAPAVAPFMARDDLLRQVRDRVREHAGLDFSDAELRDAARDGVLAAWRAGIREFVARRTTPKPTQPGPT